MPPSLATQTLIDALRRQDDLHETSLNLFVVGALTDDPEAAGYGFYLGLLHSLKDHRHTTDIHFGKYRDEMAMGIRICFPLYERIPHAYLWALELMWTDTATSPLSSAEVCKQFAWYITFAELC